MQVMWREGGGRKGRRRWVIKRKVKFGTLHGSLVLGYRMRRKDLDLHGFVFVAGWPGRLIRVQKSRMVEFQIPGWDDVGILISLSGGPPYCRRRG